MRPTPTCPRCGTVNPDGAYLCSECAENLSATVEDGTESASILAVVRSLYQRLDIPDNPPELVSWQDMYYGRTGQPNRPFSDHFSESGGTGRPVTPDFPVLVKNKILLKPMMKGKLEPEEWRPLLAASIFYHKRLRGRNNIGSLLRFSPMFLALGLFLLLFVYHELFQITPVQLIILGVFVVPSIFFLSIIWVMRYSRTVGLLADERAAEVLGRERLLEVLQKVDALKQQDFQMGRRGDWIGYGDLPSLEKRLESIQKTYHEAR